MSCSSDSTANAGPHLLTGMPMLTRSVPTSSITPWYLSCQHVQACTGRLHNE